MLALWASDSADECLLISLTLLGTGKGGECIWGGKFEDELRDILKVYLKHIVNLIVLIDVN